MRINTTELQAIRSTLGAVDPRGRIYLFGSRTDDQAIHQIARQGLRL